MFHYSEICAQAYEKYQQLEDFFSDRPSLYARSSNTPRDLTGPELSILAELEALSSDDDNAEAAKGKFATNAGDAYAPLRRMEQGFPASSEDHCAVETHTLPILSPTPRPKPLSERLATTPKADTRPLWKHASERQKFAQAIHVAEQRDGLAFTLNLSLNAHYRAVVSKNSVRLFSGYINRELKRAGLSHTPYAFAFELSKLKENGHQKLHIHGVVIADPDTADELKDALRAAGGVVEGKAAARQVKLQTLYDAGGWAVYLNKDRNLTSALLDRQTFINRDLLRLTRDDWKERRG